MNTNKTTENQIMGGTQTSKPKVTIFIKEIKNGFTVHFNQTGYVSGEYTWIAKDKIELVEVLKDVIARLIN